MSPFESLSNAFLPSSVNCTLKMMSGPVMLRRSQNLPLCFNYPGHSLLHFADRKWREPKTCTPTLDGRNYLVHIITDYAEPDILGILFNHPTKGRLSSGRHHISFIQDDQLVAFREQGAGLSEVLDTIADNVNTALVRSIELNRKTQDELV